ncbi:MAG: hypothetical protein MUP60_00900 [Candidatus Thorarchaeota archaeon]|nr:hypothetical protein [Candidatus Thorarchaeota archaeon]
MQTDYSNFARSIIELFRPISDFFQNLGIPFGPEAWMFILAVTPLLLIIILLVVRGRRSGGLDLNEGVKKIIASTGDVSSGMAGVKKLKFLKTPAEALVFLKVEENAIQQALSAVDYYVQQGEIDEGLKIKFVQAYQDRLEAVRAAIAKDEEFKSIVDTSSAVDRARSDYLQKLAAMSGTAVETDDGDKAGPSSVGMPDITTTTAPSGGAPSGGPPGGGAPGGGPPGGGAPGGGPPGGGAPGGGPPGGGAPGGDAPRAAGGKSSLQSEMLQEMERLKALMGGD